MAYIICLMRLLVYCLFFLHLPIHAQQDTTLSRLVQQFHENGKVSCSGLVDSAGFIGLWNYYDTNGNLWKSEWYSRDSAEYDILPDSTYWFRVDGSIRRSEARFSFLEWCQIEERSPKEKYVELISEKRWYYSSGMIAKKIIIISMNCPANFDSTATFSIDWYYTGELKRICTYGGVSTEFYRNGGVKLRCSSDPFGPRNGVHQVYDSSGNVIIDRTYANGKLTTARDEAYGRTDSARKLLAHRLRGVAAMSTYPGNEVSICTNLENPYSPLPTWKDSIYITQSVIDSLAYEWAGVCLILSDSLTFLKDSLLALSSRFHPNNDTWLYTIVFPVNDTSKFHISYSRGILKTDNSSFDSLIALIGYKIVSWNMRAFDYAYVIIETERAINLLNLHRTNSGSKGCLTICSGIRVRDNSLANVQVTRRDFHDMFIRMFVVLPVNKAKGKFGLYYFISNSDHEVDLKRISGWSPIGIYYRSEFQIGDD